MDYAQLSEKIKQQYQAQLPFVVYAAPESNLLNGLFQKDEKSHPASGMTEPGFVMAPFHTGEILFIPSKESTTASVPIPLINEASVRVKMAHRPSEETAYKKLVLDAINNIGTTGVSKIVTSRKATQPLKSFSITKVLDRLVQLYPTAFRYMWYHPINGIWVGATPEVLLSIVDGQFKTMALAGTQEFQKGRKPLWTEKEIAEQRWVVNDIAQRLQSVTSAIKVSKTRNHKAGNLMHLRTDFAGIIKKGNNNIGNLCRLLHPTPAICGTPREAALSFILEEEGYNRSYYTGYLGPVGTALNESHCYVNLRCMKLEEEVASLFVGGGITKDSTPQIEWEETQSKLQTMFNVLAPLL